MKLFRLTLAASVLSAALVACDATRLTAPDRTGHAPAAAPTHAPGDAGLRADDQTMGSGG
jgi:hypothetical protein